MLLCARPMPHTPTPTPSPPSFGVYVHIPWCAIRCPYCAFAVDARKNRPERAYTDAVVRQWTDERPWFPGRPDTVFFGGGTPSQADPGELARVLAAIDPVDGAEISAEVNPGKLDSGRLAELHAIGVNRVSLGVQSFRPDVARRLGRAHSAREGREVYEKARKIGFRSISIDLMFAVPGQTVDDFALDLAVILADPPEHVSLYGLTIEPGTPFERAGARLGLGDDADGLWREMYDLAVERLATIGLERYEVSNFAAAGHRCVHNEHYWRARPWVGLGASAHGFRPDHRRTRSAVDLDAYLENPSSQVDHVTPRDLAAEIVGSTLRHVDGLDLAHLSALTGLTLTVPDWMLRRGTVCQTGQSLRVRKKDVPLLDYVAARLCEGLRPADPIGTLPDRP